MNFEIIKSCGIIENGILVYYDYENFILFSEEFSITTIDVEGVTFVAVVFKNKLKQIMEIDDEVNSWILNYYKDYKNIVSIIPETQAHFNTLEHEFKIFISKILLKSLVLQ